MCGVWDYVLNKWEGREDRPCLQGKVSRECVDLWVPWEEVGMTWALQNGKAGEKAPVGNGTRGRELWFLGSIEKGKFVNSRLHNLFPWMVSDILISLPNQNRPLRESENSLTLTCEQLTVQCPLTKIKIFRVKIRVIAINFSLLWLQMVRWTPEWTEWNETRNR